MVLVVYREERKTMRGISETNNVDKRVSVVYYISRNGQLEHPHFMEVSLASNHGLYLRDVINRLIVLRGKAMVKMYSWSSKRSYKNGFVWHDLSEDDLVQPVNGNEYVLKGTEILHHHTNTSSSSSPPLITHGRRQRITHHTNQSADAWTQTDQTLRRRRRRALLSIDTTNSSRGETPLPEAQNTTTTELRKDEISPPPSPSSPETLEALIRASADVTGWSSGRMRASAVLMQLLSCGSLAAKEQRRVDEEIGFGALRLEEKEYFSGSFVEIMKKKKKIISCDKLKRSSSFNDEERGLKMEIRTESRCMPTKLKSRRDGTSKRINYEPTIIT